jgi:hypothetical protein
MWFYAASFPVLALRFLTCLPPSDALCKVSLLRFDLKALPVDFVECLMFLTFSVLQPLLSVSPYSFDLKALQVDLVEFLMFLTFSVLQPLLSVSPYSFDLKALPVDFVECLMRFLPTEAEGKTMRQYERERRPLDALTDEDRFMLFFSKIERLTQRMNIITFVGNFSDNVGMLTPQLNAIIAASASVKSSPKLKRMLEVRLLALGFHHRGLK